MKKLVAACAAIAVSALAVPAGAVTFVVGPANTGPLTPAFAPGATVYNFDDGTSPFSAGSARTDEVANQYARPAGDTSRGYYALTATQSPATLSRSNFGQVSFYWGSIDSYNTITFLGLNGNNSFSGSVFDGTDATRNARQVTFFLSQAEAAAVTGIQLTTTSNAFELDNFVIGNAVPEPTTYGIMTLGLGMIGGVLRRRRSTVSNKAVRFA